MYFLGLITRCKDEFFIKEFCDYYISQGVDKIFVIDDDSLDKSIYNGINEEKVKIIYEKGLFSNGRNPQMYIANKYYKKIRKDFKWIISVDVDEFITTKKNINRTLREELSVTFKNIDCIKIPWVMMSSNNRINNPKSILRENTYRWNHDKTHPHKVRKFRCRHKSIEVKCIFKPEKFLKIDTHFPKDKVNKIKVINSVNLNNEPLSSFYNNLRENDITNGYLLCYHYRIISQENNLKKLNKYNYSKFNRDDLIKSDYSEIKDLTMKKKSELYLDNQDNVNNLDIKLKT